MPRSRLRFPAVLCLCLCAKQGTARSTGQPGLPRLPRPQFNSISSAGRARIQQHHPRHRHRRRRRQRQPPAPAPRPAAVVPPAPSQPCSLHSGSALLCLSVSLLRLLPFARAAAPPSVPSQAVRPSTHSIHRAPLPSVSQLISLRQARNLVEQFGAPIRPPRRRGGLFVQLVRCRYVTTAPAC
ncbi:hypothetical protein VFPBJ_07264 [Purpureocillium lilacinum]|uniref:Uncharacterized protein n=1 Tax=Purpureocillium lilacinum TaxID=33203 RepID=A0A179GP93_PURLI|nr:hypothetical protein VFPBJ_07264 [Purpureocillium lilacinum]